MSMLDKVRVACIYLRYAASLHGLQQQLTRPGVIALVVRRGIDNIDVIVIDGTRRITRALYLRFYIF